MKHFSIKKTFSVKRILIVTCTLLALIVLFTIAFEWYFNPARLPEDSPLKARARRIADLKRRAFTPGEELGREDVEVHVQKLADDNGAKYYLTAALELKGHSGNSWSNEQWNRLAEIGDTGWRTEEPEVDELLQENEQVFELVREGTQRSYCSFPDEEPLGKSISFYASGFQNIARLFVGKAKYYEKERAFDKTRETYSDALRFIAAVSNNGSIIHALFGDAMESITYPAITGYLEVLDDEAVCEQFLADLVDIEKSRGSLHDVLAREFARQRRTFENIDFGFESRYLLYYGGLKDPFDYLPKDTSEKLVASEYVADAFIRAGGYIACRVWSPIQMRRTRRQLDEFASIVLDASKQPYPQLIRAGLEEKIPANMSSSTLLPEIVSGFVVSYGTSEVDRRAMIIRTALHLYFLRNGAFPETLSELVPTVPEEILIDPFSSSRFMYKKTDKGYLFYSLGPDLDDDGGENFEYSKNSGDLVFFWPNNTGTNDAQKVLVGPE